MNTMNNPEEIKIESDAVVVDEVTEYSFYPAEEEKLPLLVNLLKRQNHERILVFVNTRHGVEKVADVLSANGVSNGALSGVTERFPPWVSQQKKNNEPGTGSRERQEI